jgi:protocatechuate 3,4-dioxygenase beta subunit
MIHAPLGSLFSRRELAELALFLPGLALALQSSARKVTTATGGEPQFVEPPGELPAAVRRRIEELAAALAAGTTSANDVLADPGSNDLRPFPLFRERIAEHAVTGRAVLVPRGEPGTPLAVALRVVRRGGAPYSGVRVYAYQTCSKGWYAAEAPHVEGNSGDFRFARLFTHGVTDADGRLELVTVHPAGYPRTELPSHIHLLLEGAEGHVRGTEVRFEDCPRMTPAVRAESLRAGFLVVPVETRADGSARCAAEFTLPAG